MRKKISRCYKTGSNHSCKDAVGKSQNHSTVPFKSKVDSFSRALFHNDISLLALVGHFFRNTSKHSN